MAEIGKNFIQTEGERSVGEYLENAKKLVKSAKEAGADAVKFQTHNVEDEQLNIHAVSPHFKGADRYSWVLRNTNATPLETFWRPLKSYCDQLGIIFFTTPMSRGAAQKINEFVPLWKVGSGDILDFVTLDFMVSTGKPIIISSGMSTIEEIDTSISYLKNKGANAILMHCVSRYPCPPEALYLFTIPFLKKRYEIPVGFSDHSIGHDSALAAVALGASVIEKHFSFSRDLWGADHKVSMTPQEFGEMVLGIRELEQDSLKKEAYLQKEAAVASMGSGVKVLQPEEAVFPPYFRKSLTASRDIPIGAAVIPEMLYAMRPQKYSGGLPSEKYEEVLGKRVKKNIKKYEPIRQEDLA